MQNFGKEVKSFVAVKLHGDVAVTSRTHVVATSQNNLSATNIYAWLHICCAGSSQKRYGILLQKRQIYV